MSLAAFTETVLRRDRSTVLAGLVSIVLVSWAYIIYLARDMATMMNMSNANLGMGMAMPAIQPWGAVDDLLMFIMWSARRLLRRLLLADDGLALCGRCHEPVLDRRHRRSLYD